MQPVILPFDSGPLERIEQGRRYGGTAAAEIPQNPSAQFVSGMEDE